MFSTTQSIWSPVWIHATRYNNGACPLRRVQRVAAVGIISAHMTVSLEAVVVLTGTSPIHHVLGERRCPPRVK